VGGVRGYRPNLCGSQKLADPHHHIARIGPAAALAPLLHLLREIGGRLAGERRIGRAATLARSTVAAGAGRQAACGITALIQPRHLLRHGRFGFEGHRRIVQRDRQPFARIELSGNPRHLGMVPPSVCVCFELPFEVPGIEARKPRSTRAIALPSEPMASEAGVRRSSPGPAKCDNPPIAAEAFVRRGLWGAAGVQRRHRQNKEAGAPQHSLKLTARRNAGFQFLLLSLAVAACKPPPEDRQSMPMGKAEEGLSAIERVGCGSCHTIPGVRWPQGTVGPALSGLANRALIAGQLPNRPDVLATYIRNAPALVPGSAMPAMPLSEVEARDIAAYLYEVGAH
jgi:mono/diheme cytochrome c family protein